MSYNFNAEEIFLMSEEIEKNGAKFYRSAAADIKNPLFNKLLLELAANEDVHEKVFANLRAALSEKEKMPTVFDPEGEAQIYLKALVDTQVFFKKELPDTKQSKPEKQIMEDILRFAIGIEKDSIVFYLGMKEWVPEVLGKDKIDSIIKEEMNHVRILSRELANIK
ncbi:MAG: ferritin family protein [Desulfobacterales bacterium]|nr:ferritin family protein [Desulfobacterales bacterium]MBF0398594.1 ferritin family protein [Desulfobacterales bacterium]